MAVILANPLMIDAYKAGIPATASRSPTAPSGKGPLGPEKAGHVPDGDGPGTLHDVDFMVKDSKRFADSGSGDGARLCTTPGPASLRPPPGRHAAAGERRQVRAGCHTIVKNTRLRVHGLREALNRQRPKT